MLTNMNDPVQSTAHLIISKLILNFYHRFEVKNWLEKICYHDMHSALHQPSMSIPQLTAGHFEHIFIEI